VSARPRVGMTTGGMVRGFGVEILWRMALAFDVAGETNSGGPRPNAKIGQPQWKWCTQKIAKGVTRGAKSCEAGEARRERAAVQIRLGHTSGASAS
jgi:hypothetical protein